MDRGGQFSRPLNGAEPSAQAIELAAPSRWSLFFRRVLARMSDQPRTRRIEFVFVLVFFALTGLYGAERGGHFETLAVALRDAGNALARTAGFGIRTVEIAGARQLSRDDVLRQAGIDARSSLLLLDADEMRAELQRNPWVAKARVRKLYPNRLEIEIKEREPFAVWQRDGALRLIARDGTVLGPAGAAHATLPLVVGLGAEKRAAQLLELIGRFPVVGNETRAAILVAERRWNLRLNNGIDVRLPEDDPAAALARLTALHRDKQILSRDVTMIDLRMPDRIAVRLSDEAAQSLPLQKPKRKGADT